MPTEFQYKKHVKIVVDLEKGDRVFTDGWSGKLDNKEWIVEDIKLSPGSESAVSVKINGYAGYIDSGWLIKASEQPSKIPTDLY